MLARVAQTLYWIARDLERAETYSRLLEVTHATGLDSGVRDGDLRNAVWEPLIRIAGDLDQFLDTHRAVEERSVSWFISFGPDNDDSIVACVNRARESARSVRDRLPTEVWEGINRLYLDLAEWPPGRIAREGLYPFCQEVRRSIYLITGLIDQGMRRDAGWQFMRVGRHLERVDKAVSLFQVKYTHRVADPEVGAPLDVQQWHSLLLSASANEAYLQAEPTDLSAESIGRFLLLDPRFPRSVSYCLAQIDRGLEALVNDEAMPEGAAPLILIRTARQMIDEASRAPWGRDLDDLLQRLRARAATLDTALAEACFESSYERTPPRQHEQATRQAQN